MVDLSNETNWTIIHQSNRFLNGQPSKINYLAPLLIPIPFLNPYFRVYALNSEAKPAWWMAGSCELMIGVVDNPLSIRGQSQLIPLDQWQLLNFPLTDSQNFHLRFSSAFWHRNMDLEIQQYQEPFAMSFQSTPLALTPHETVTVETGENPDDTGTTEMAKAINHPELGSDTSR